MPVNEDYKTTVEQLEHELHEATKRVEVALARLEVEMRTLTTLTEERIRHVERRVDSLTSWVKPVLAPVLAGFLTALIALAVLSSNKVSGGEETDPHPAHTQPSTQ